MSRKGLALTLAAVMALTIALPALGQTNPFRDVPLDHWAYDAIAELAAAGLVEGYPDGTFGGERTFTRYEMAMVFARILARFEALLQDEVAAAVDERVAELKAAIEALAAQIGTLPDGRAPIILEQRQREDGAVEAAVRLSPEMEEAVRAVVADQLRRELAQLPPEAVLQLADDQTLQEVLDARTSQLASWILQLAEEFDAELSLLGVRVAELERLFGDVNERLTAVEQQAAEAQSAAETAVGIADAAKAAADAAAAAAAEARERADAAWRLLEALRSAGVSDAELAEALALATSTQEAADSAEERAYRSQLAAERAAALAEEAREAAEQAAHDAAVKALEEAARQAEEARAEAAQAMERAQRADQQAYRARLAAERALARLDDVESDVKELQEELARRPRIGVELRADYESTSTSTDEKVPLDPRKPWRKGDEHEIGPNEEFSTSVGFTASFSPAEGVDVEGGLRLKANWFGTSTDDVKATDLHFKATTPGVLRMAYFGAVTPDEITQGFSKYVLDPKTYAAKVAKADRGGAILDAQIGSMSTRFIAGRYPEYNDNGDPDNRNFNRNFYGFTATLPLEQGLNLGVNYLWWSQEERAGALQAFGDTAGFNYDLTYAFFKENPIVDAQVKTNFGDLAVGFQYKMVDDAFEWADPKDPNKPEREDLQHLGKLFKKYRDDVLPGQARWVADASLPVGILTVVAEKGRHDKKLDQSEFTDWVKYGFRDLDVFGFQIGALGYNDSREADKRTQAYRVDVSREFQLGLPLKFTASYAAATINDAWVASGTVDQDHWAHKTKTHFGVGVAVEDHQLTEALFLDARLKTEQNPIGRNKWTEPERWNALLKTDDDEIPTFHRDVAGATVKFKATENFTLSAGYQLERLDTTDDKKRDTDVRTTTVGALWSLRLAETDVTLGYGYELQEISGPSIVFDASPKTTWSVGLKRELLGATVDALYKVVRGRGIDKWIKYAGKVDAVDTIARVDVTYPIAEGMDFTLSGKWGESSGNADPDDNYSYASIRAGVGVKF